MTSAAGPNPTARMTFVAPDRRLPCANTSMPNPNRHTSTPNGMEPTR